MKKWNVVSEFDPKKEIDEQLLSIRGISSAKEIKEFINPKPVSQITTEFSADFTETLEIAKDLINKAVKSEQNIIIYGDYDADGICATAILFNYFKHELNYEKIGYFIPNRFDNGYGLSKNALEELTNKYNGEKLLIITVDSGITAVEEVDLAKKLGHTVIITDHHQKPVTMPNADAVVWDDNVVGTTLAWILADALGSKNTQSISFAAIATITDLQKVIGVNRSFVKYGLEVLNTNPPVGIKKLIEVSGKNVSEISTYELGWVIGPRLNASGRLEAAELSLRLLLSQTDNEAEIYARELNELNSQRQNKTIEMYEFAMVSENEKLPKIIFSSDENYHEGIIGLVAARLAQKYHRPSIVISTNGDMGKGSVRSIKNINIIEMLRTCEELFESVGGHPMAAGFTIKQANIELLQSKMIELADKTISDEDLIPEINIDLKLPAQEINLENLKKVENLKPFGLGNEEPVFLTEEFGILDVSFVGKDKSHMLIKMRKDGNYYKGIFFNGIDRNFNLNFGDKINVVYTLKRNDYNGNTYVDLIIKDLK